MVNAVDRNGREWRRANEILPMLDDHKRSIALINSELGSIRRDVDHMQHSQSTIVSKLDKMHEDLTKEKSRPHIPSLRESAITVVAIIGIISGIYTGASYWFGTEFAKGAKDLESSISKLDGRVTRVERYFKIKPALAPWVAQAEQ